MAGKVRVSHADRITQPGKQAVTFLLVANVAIFFMNLFESEKAGVSEIIIGERIKTTSTPFYRSAKKIFYEAQVAEGSYWRTKTNFFYSQLHFRLLRQAFLGVLG